MMYRYRSVRPATADAAEPVTPAKERIVEAAVELYGEKGFDPVTLKVIASRAGVSASLIVHHFGSSRGLRTACDRYAAEQLRRAKTEMVRHEGPLPLITALEVLRSSQFLMKYLMRAFATGGPEMDELFDQLVEDALEYTAEAEKEGLVYPSPDPHSRAVVLLLHSFATLTFHRQLERHLGASPLTSAPADLRTYLSTAMEIYTRPVINAEIYNDFFQSAPSSTTATTGGDLDE